MDESERVPVLAGWHRDDGLGLKVFCRWCDRWHHHSGAGHRAAHCGSDTPYRETGYVILENPNYTHLAEALPTIDGEQAIAVCLAEVRAS